MNALNTQKTVYHSVVRSKRPQLNIAIVISVVTLLTVLCVRRALAKESGEAETVKRRIVSLGGGVTESLFALGASELIVGVDTSSVYPIEATRLPKVGYIRATSAEGIVSLKPDLVIASDSIGPPNVKTQLRAAGIDLLLVPEVKSVDAIQDRLKKLGEAVHREEKAQELITSIQRVLDTPVPSEDRPKVLFLFSHGGGRLMVAGRATAAHAMIERAGGMNAITAYEGYRALTAESVVVAQPEIILITERSLNAIKGDQGLWNLPSFSLTPAGKKQRKVVMEDLKLLGFGPRTGEAILELRQAFFQGKP